MNDLVVKRLVLSTACIILFEYKSLCTSLNSIVLPVNIEIYKTKCKDHSLFKKWQLCLYTLCLVYNLVLTTEDLMIG